MKNMITLGCIFSFALYFSDCCSMDRQPEQFVPLEGAGHWIDGPEGDAFLEMFADVLAEELFRRQMLGEEGQSPLMIAAKETEERQSHIGG